MADSDILIRVRTDGIAGAETALNRLRDVGVRTELVTDSMARAFERNNRAVQANQVAFRAMQGIGIVSFLGGMAGAVAMLNDQYTNLTNKLINANTANERLVDVQQRVFDIAQRSRTSLESTATLYARMERSLSQYGATAQQVARVTETVSKAMIVSGATTAEANAAIIQLSQGLQSGTLRGDEFRSVMEQAPRLAKAMADSLGVTTGELRALSMQGKLTADVVAGAIYRASEVIDKEFNNTVATFGQKLQMAQNNLIRFAGTSESVSGTTSALGDGILLLSNNLDVVATAVGVLATAFTGRLITALAASAAASVRNTLAQQQETLAARALTSARVQDAAAAYQQAQAALATAAAERTAIQAALAANQQYYKGIATTNAYIQNTRLVRTATAEVAVAQTALSTALNVATTQARVAAVAMTALRTTMGLLGGPAGIIMLAVGALYMWNQSQEQAVQNARALATDTDTLRDRLAKLTTEQQKALQVELQRAQVKLVDQLREEQNELNELQNRLYNANQAMKNSTEGSWAYKDAQQAVKEITDDITVKTGDLSTTQTQLSNTRSNLKTVTDNLAEGERGLRAAVQETNAAMNLATKAATQRSDDLTKALQAQQSEADVATLKLNGNARAASVLADVQSRMPKVYAQNKAFIDDLIAGHSGLTTVMTNEQLGIKEFIDQAGKAYDAQEKLRQNKKDDAQSKRDAAAAVRYQEQWDKAYERTEARGATAIDRLRIQQDAEVRAIQNKAERAGATQEQLGAALRAIDEKYARERQKVADEYNPASKIATNYREALETISQLQRAGLLDDEQTNQAKLRAEATYLQERMRLVQEQAVSERDQLRGEYDPVIAAQNQYAEELALLTEAHDQKLMEDNRFYELRHAAYTRFLQEQGVAQNQEVLSFLASTSTMADSMATVLASMGAKNSAAYKAMFALSKSFAIAEATIKLTQATVQAMADPTAITPMQKFANYAAVAAAGASLISQITSATMTGMAHDGITEIPKEGTWLLQKGERVLSAQQNADFTNFMRNGGSGNTPTVSGGNVTQYITVSGAGDQALADAVQRATADGAEQGYNRVLVDVTNRGNVSRKIGR
jgi:tape measure domain-containing protein